MFKIPLYDYHGERLTKSEIARRSGTNVGTIESRMARYGITVEEAADMTPMKRKFHDYNGEKATVPEVSRKTGISCATLYGRIYRYGCTLGEAAAMGPDMIFRKNPESREDGRRIAMRIFTSLFMGERPKMSMIRKYSDEMHFREAEPGVFRFESETYDFRVAVREDGAELTAVVRSTGETSIRRFFARSNGEIKIQI